MNTDCNNKRELTAGMMKWKVVEILGEPSQIEKDGDIEICKWQGQENEKDMIIQFKDDVAQTILYDKANDNNVNSKTVILTIVGIFAFMILFWGFQNHNSETIFFSGIVIGIMLLALFIRLCIDVHKIAKHFENEDKGEG